MVAVTEGAELPNKFIVMVPFVQVGQGDIIFEFPDEPSVIINMDTFNRGIKPVRPKLRVRAGECQPIIRRPLIGKNGQLVVFVRTGGGFLAYIGDQAVTDNTGKPLIYTRIPDGSIAVSVH